MRVRQTAMTSTQCVRLRGHWVSRIIGGVGVAAAAGGIVLWLTAPKETVERRAAVVPQVSPDGAGLAVVGTFLIP